MATNLKFLCEIQIYVQQKPKEQKWFQDALLKDARFRQAHRIISCFSVHTSERFINLLLLFILKQIILGIMPSAHNANNLKKEKPEKMPTLKKHRPKRGLWDMSGIAQTLIVGIGRHDHHYGGMRGFW